MSTLPGSLPWPPKAELSNCSHAFVHPSTCSLYSVYLSVPLTRASPVAQRSQICLPCKRARFDPWVRKIPWRRAWQPTPGFLPGKILWTEELGRLQFMGSQRVGHDWSNWACIPSLEYKPLKPMNLVLIMINPPPPSLVSDTRHPSSNDNTEKGAATVPFSFEANLLCPHVTSICTAVLASLRTNWNEA